MIVGAYVEHAAPDHPAGAEWTIHDTLAWLAAQRGHDSRVVSVHGYTQKRGEDGVLVYCQPTDDELVQHFQECDVMITQLGGTMRAQLLAATYQTPLVQYVHSATQLDNLGVIPACSALVVFNSQHVADACHWWPGDTMILHPAIDPERVRVERPGQCTTLINLSPSKGGPQLFKLAQEMEGLPFLGVQGAYGHQALTPDGLALATNDESPTGLPPMLRVSGPLRDIREALAYTRTLLVLSHTETYGRVAVEAACSGIPTICFDTPGLREALGPAGIYVDRDAPTQLQHLVKRSYTPAWDEWSEAAEMQWRRVLARQERELRSFDQALRGIVKEQPVMTL